MTRPGEGPTAKAGVEPKSTALEADRLSAESLLQPTLSEKNHHYHSPNLSESASQISWNCVCKVITDLASMAMFISGVWEELWPLSTMVEKQSLTEDEAVSQKKKVKIPSYLSREASKGKSTHTRNPSTNEMQCKNQKL